MCCARSEKHDRSAGFPFRVEKGTVRLEGAFKPRFFEDESLHATPNTATIKHLHQHWMPRVEWMHIELIKHLSSESILAAASKSDSIRDVAPWFADYTREVRTCAMGHVRSRGCHHIAARWSDGCAAAATSTYTRIALVLAHNHIRSLVPHFAPSDSTSRCSDSRSNILCAQLARLGMFQGHEMVDHPMAAIYAISFHADGGCAKATTDLLQKHLKPSDDNSSFSQAMASRTVFPLWHPDFPRHFVIVLDAKQGAHEPIEVTRAVAAVQKAAAAAVGSDGIVKVSAVVLNSDSGGANSAGAGVSWARFRHSSLSCPGRHRVVACAGEALQQIDLKRDEGVTAPARGGWLSQKNLEDVTAVVNAFLRAPHTPHSCTSWKWPCRVCGSRLR